MKIRRPLFDFSDPDHALGIGLYFVVFALMQFGVGLAWGWAIAVGIVTQFVFHLEYMWAKHDLSARLRREKDDE